MTPEEREQALREELEMCRQIIRDVRFIARAGLLQEYQGEPWLRRVMNIDLNFDPTALTARQRA